MAWLNNGCPLVIDPNLGLPTVIDNQVEFSKLSENARLRFYQSCQEIFTQENTNNISSEEACYKYSDLFAQNDDLKFFSLCFELLPICFFKNDVSSNTNYRDRLIKACRLFKLPDSDFSKLLCYLAFNQTNTFCKGYIEQGGTEAAKKLLLEIHHANNIEWWTQELFLFSTNLNASDFDIEFINYILNDTIDCGHFFLTMVITLFYHRLNIDRQSIIDYATDNIPNNFTSQRDNLIYNILISRRQDLSAGTTSPEFLKKIYKSTLNSLFTVHFLGLTLKEASIIREFRIAVLRYLELLSSYEDRQYRSLIPYYLNSITQQDQNEYLILQNVFPAISDGMPKSVLDEMSKLETFEKEYCLKSIHKVNEIKFNIDNKYCDDSNSYESVSQFLNENFLQCDRKIQRQMMKTLVDFNDNSEEENENDDLTHFNSRSDDKNYLSNLNNLNESVVVGMIESYSGVDGKKKEKAYLEQHLFDYIASNGDIPEYGS